MTTETVSTTPGPSGLDFAAIVDTANDVVIVTTANLEPPGPTIVYVNEAFTRLTGYTPGEAIGRSPRMLQGPGTSRSTLDRIRAGLNGGQDVRQTVLNYAKSGAPYWLDLRIVPIRAKDGAITNFAAIERDVTIDKRRLDELEYLADRDTLTGIPNRRALMRQAEAEFGAAQRRGSEGPCVAYIDIDLFKGVNDEMGHAVGDAVLFGVADRLAENIRRVDLVGRIGGEEFAVCMPGLALTDALALADRLRRAVARAPFPTAAGPIAVTVSIGVAATRHEDSDLSEVVGRADAALYRAKRTGRDRIAC